MRCPTLPSIFVSAALAALATGCHATPPPSPDIESVTWASYSNARAGYSLSYPDLYTVEEDGSGLLLRHEGYPVVAIRHTTEREARHRGLWFGHDPARTIELAGRSGLCYVYNHCDGPFCMRTVSYVVEHGGKHLGLEFRTELERPDEVQRRILESFRFD